MSPIQIQHLSIGKGHPLAFILGPCVIEDRTTMLQTAEFLHPLFQKYPCIFKSSFDKANRSSITSYRGPGLDGGLQILQEISEQFGFLLTTDIHEVHQVQAVAEICDLLQVPAFLSRQTDLLLAAAKTQKPINVKKGQFMAPEDTKQVIEKVRSMKNANLLLTERGTCFGYHTLINDMRAIPTMQALGVPVCFDMSHSVQRPSAHGTHSGGDKQHAYTLAKAAIAAGANAIFLETHPSPSKARCDQETQLALEQLDTLLSQLTKLHAFVQNGPAVHV